MRASNAKLAFKVQGLDCAEEIATLKAELGALVGGEDRLAFDILQGKLIVESDDVPADDVIRAVARTGMRAEVWGEGRSEEQGATAWQTHGRTVLTLACAVFGLLGFLAHFLTAESVSEVFGSEGMGAAVHDAPLISIVLYVAGIVAGIWYIVPKAWRAASSMRPDMNLLMTIAVIGAASIGEWFEAVTVSFLFSVSLLLESWSVGRARRAISALMAIAPLTARIRDQGGGEREVAPQEVAVGSTFVVRSGEQIPLDGVVARGHSDVNQAPITGESSPVDKSPGSQVFAGTINGDGVLEVECTRLADDSTLARMIQMVGEARSRRAPSEQWVEKFASVYTPIVLTTAVAVLLIPPTLFGGAWSDWIYRSLVLLVIACPCALVISTPVSVVSSLAAAARNGVLIKGGLFVEAPAKLKAIALDKTGTLTEGKPAVVEVVPLGGHNESELLERAAALEAHSNHPLAQAIVAEAQRRGVAIPVADEVESVQGKGATGRVAGKPYWLGSHRYLEERRQEIAQVHKQLEAMQRAGRSVVVVGNDEHVCGLIGLADSLRPTAAETLKQLHALGIEHVVMLTGDNAGTAQAIAAEAGIDEVRAELLPQDKVSAVESLVARYGQVAMVGDGVNDAPALGRASLGIAMGAAGSDAAIETADIALMSDDLAKLPWLIRHSHRTLAVIRQNIIFSLAVKAVFVVLTITGLASLWAAIAADTGASLLVVSNGLRLLHQRN